MSLRDELAKFAACPEWLDETMKIIERALAAERAEMECGHPHACLKTRPFVPSDYPYEPPLSRTEEFCTACERLAAERAATRLLLAEQFQKKAAAFRVGTREPTMLSLAQAYDEAAQWILSAVREDRSALDAILAQAANNFAVAKGIDEMARELATKCLQSFSLQTSEHPDATRLRDVCYTLLGTEGHNAKTFSEALAQARREQREKDVAAVKFFCDGHRRQALSAEEAAAAIRAPAAPVRQRGEPARQRGEQED